MSDQQKPDNLTEGWPDEPGKSEIEAFARDLAGKLPELPADAMQRIGGQMHDEMALRRWRKRRFRFAIATAVAASAVIGIGIWRALDTAEKPPAAINDPVVHAVPPVRDQYRVPVMATPVLAAPDPNLLLEKNQGDTAMHIPTNAQPIIAIEKHRSVFE